MVHVVIGSQWGDEGKGKIVDILAAKADYCIRFQGGNNAGHTVVNPLGTFPLHLVPSGIFNPRCRAVIAGGTVINLSVLIGEIEMLAKKLDISGRLVISPRCHVIMPYHIVLDGLYEAAKGTGRTGTTGRGIGPVYADKVSYNGIRLYDLYDRKAFLEKLTVQIKIKNKIIRGLGGKPLRIKDVYQEKLAEFVKLKPFIAEPLPELYAAYAGKKYVLCEGAQGVFLDNDWGTYPFVTASSVVSGSVTAGTGIPSREISRVTGVVKAYTTRVGAGPFPTELSGTEGETLRIAGHEFGTTTGRPRRCGWFDAEMVKFAARLNGFTDIAVTKLDVLDTLPKINICTGYKLKGKRVSYADGDAGFLGSVQPLYEELPGWKTATGAIRSLEKLPPEARRYIREIERLTGVPVKMISVGPDRKQTIRC